MKVDQISSIIKEQLKNYNSKTDSSENGKVIAVGDGISIIYGLKNAQLGELLEFDNGVLGIVLNLEQDSVGAVLVGEERGVREGSIVKRTGKIVETGVGDAYLGRVVNGFGEPIDELGEIKYSERRPVEKIAPGVMTRSAVNEPLQTGIMAIDAMIPIGKGQRELIIGDRQTGKTAIALDTIINQKGKDVYCIYVGIGQKNSTIAQIVANLKLYNALSHTTIVSATASEPAPLQYLSPYVAITIAEYWMEKGKNVLIVYDDLSKHAVAYRTLSLLLRRPPGREAYPGDVFYLHSRLLERSAKLNKKYGGGSITALPIIETQAGDISAYIPTNVISITDGQIFLVKDLFNSGQRPAVDSGLSVSRVGGDAQIKAVKKAVSTLRIELAQYKELKAFSQFGSDLDKATLNILNHGEKTTEILKQQEFKPISQIDQVILLTIIKSKIVDVIPKNDVLECKKMLIHYFEKHGQKIKKEIAKTEDLSNELIKKIEALSKMALFNHLRTIYDEDSEEYKIFLQLKK